MAQKLNELCTFLEQHPNATRQKIMEECFQNNLSRAGFYRLIGEANRLGILATQNHQGSSHSSGYQLSEQHRIQGLKDKLSTSIHNRPRVGYIQDWLDDYVPNQSRLLSDVDLKRLHARCPPGSAPLESIHAHDLSMFMCEISYASSHMEGNSYSLLDTIKLLEYQHEKSGGNNTDKIMILNHREAVRYVIDSIKDKDPRFGMTPYTVRSLHTILSQDLLTNPSDSGRLRDSRVEIAQSAYIPLDIKDKIEENFNKIIQKAALINDPYEASFFLTTHLSYLQPFVDCNKRTSRITSNISLLQNGITPISWMEAAAREKDYKEALIAVYEFNDTTLLSEVFVENFMRSVERFAIMRRSKEPSAIAAQYRTQLKEYVRAHVETGSTDIPDNVESQDQEAFTAYADQEIAALKANDMIGIRYGLSPEKIAQWMENNEENNANTPNNVYEKNK